MEQRTRLNFCVWCQKSCTPRVGVWGRSRATRLRLEKLQTHTYTRDGSSFLIVPSHKHRKAQFHWHFPQKHAYDLQNLLLFISFHINSLEILPHLPTLHKFINLFHFFFFFGMPSSVVLRSHRFLFTLLSTHNTTRPWTHRRKMERGRRRWRRRRKWEKEMPPPMSGLEISRNLCQRNWWGNAVMLVV